MRLKISSSIVALAVIFILGFLLRILWINVGPPGFNADEAALGYNGYSLLQTGKDEWGDGFPIVFKSFSDYKPGLYVYMALPFIAGFGLNEFAVRIPSILLGTFSILLIYLLAKELFKKNGPALAAAFILSISPWHIHFSRGAWEANVATFFILLGVYALIKSFEKHWFLWISAISFIASMYTYQSARLVTPALVFLLLIFYWKKLLIKKNIVMIVVSLVLLFPLILILPTAAGMARLNGVSMFSDPGPLNRLNEERGEHQDSASIWAKLSHNKLLTYSKSFFVHYQDHYSPNFLFISGGSLKRNEEPDMGQMYMFEAITLILGLYSLIRNKFSNGKVVLIWLIVAPLASSLTFQTPDAHRSHNMVVPLSLISGLGLSLLWEDIVRLARPIRYLCLVLIISIIGISFASYLDRYYVHTPKQYALEWEYGFSQVIPYVAQNQDKYQKIIMTDRYDQPYVLLLFYSKYNPARYQETFKKIGDNKFGFTTITSFDKFEFRPIAKDEINRSKNTLFIGTESEIGSDKTPLRTIRFPNGKPAFLIIGT